MRVAVVDIGGPYPAIHIVDLESGNVETIKTLVLNEREEYLWINSGLELLKNQYDSILVTGNCMAHHWIVQMMDPKTYTIANMIQADRSPDDDGDKTIVNFARRNSRNKR